MKPHNVIAYQHRKYTTKDSEPTGILKYITNTAQSYVQSWLGVPKDQICIVTMMEDRVVKVQSTDVTRELINKFINKATLDAKEMASIRDFFTSSTGTNIKTLTDDELRMVSHILLKTGDLDMVEALLNDGGKKVLTYLIKNPNVFEQLMAHYPEDALKIIKELVLSVEHEVPLLNVRPKILSILIKNPSYFYEVSSLLNSANLLNNINALDWEKIINAIPSDEVDDIFKTFSLAYYSEILLEMPMSREDLKRRIDFEKAKFKNTVLDQYPNLQEIDPDIFKVIMMKIRPPIDIINTLEIFNEHPDLLQMDSKVLRGILTKGQNIQDFSVPELLMYLVHDRKNIDIIKGLWHANKLTELEGQVTDKIAVQGEALSLAVNILFVKNDVYKIFGLKKEDVIVFLNNCSDEDLEAIKAKLKTDEAKGLRPFFKEFISRMFAAEEKKILQNIEPAVLSDRNKLVKYFEAFQPKSYVIEKLLVQAQIWQEMGKNEKLKDFPFNEIWRFVMDGDCEIKGAYFFEDEPGYIVKTLRGLLKAFENKEKPSLSQYKDLHDIIIDNVYKSEFQTIMEDFIPFDKGFTQRPARFRITTSDIDEVGLTDLSARSNTNAGGVPFRYGEITHEIVGMEINDDNLQYVEKKFADMNAFIIGKSPVMRFMTYIWLARELELMHIFSDANGRSSIILLYQLVANDPDIPMILLHNPNVFDGNGPEKLLYRMLEDMVKFKDFGAWKQDGHQISRESLSLEKLDLTDHPELAKFRDQCLQEIDHMSWADFHARISGGK